MHNSWALLRLMLDTTRAMLVTNRAGADPRTSGSNAGVLVWTREYKLPSITGLPDHVGVKLGTDSMVELSSPVGSPPAVRTIAEHHARVLGSVVRATRQIRDKAQAQAQLEHGQAVASAPVFSVPFK